jgi:hypothetical protein
VSQPFQEVFDALRRRIEQHDDGNVVARDEPDEYILLGPDKDEAGRDVYIAHVKIRKSYVSLYLMSVYRFPELLDDVAPVLLDRKHGKSCFNFKEPDDAAFDEVSKLLERGIERYREKGLLPET